MDIRAILMGLAFAAMWSSAFTSARIIVEYAPPLTALALRFLISGLIGVGIAAALGQSARLTSAAMDRRTDFWTVPERAVSGAELCRDANG